MLSGTTWARAYVADRTNHLSGQLDCRRCESGGWAIQETSPGGKRAILAYFRGSGDAEAALEIMLRAQRDSEGRWMANPGGSE